VLINGGSSYTRWNANGIEHGTMGIWREHAATHSLLGPKSLPTSKGYEARCELQDSGAAGGASASR